jgi:hypothetical protein
VPAECEMENCGVLAIGRCIDCSKAFCASHQALGYTAPVANLCARCSSKRDAARNAPATQAWEVIASAPARLSKLGVPRDHVVRVTQRVEKKRLRRDRVVPQIEDEQGWRLGAIPWQLSRMNVRLEDYSTVKNEQCETFLLDRKGGAGLVRIKEGPDGWEPIEGWDARLEEVGNGYDPESAAGAIEQLAERHASPADP